MLPQWIADEIEINQQFVPVHLIWSNLSGPTYLGMCMCEDEGEVAIRFEHRGDWWVSYMSH
jgi:hypothetical protein